MKDNKRKHFSMDSHEEIAKKAYELYEQSGRIPGRDVENWVEAKRLIDESGAKENEERNYEEESGMGMERQGHGMGRGMHKGKHCHENENVKQIHGETFNS